MISHRLEGLVMEPIWIILLGVVAVIVVGLAIALAVRRRRTDDHAAELGPQDQPDHSQDARIAEASRFRDRSGWSAGGGV